MALVAHNLNQQQGLDYIGKALKAFAPIYLDLILTRNVLNIETNKATTSLKLNTSCLK